MSTRKIKDAKDLSTNELIYFRNHAKATFMSDGSTVEDSINLISKNIGSKQDAIEDLETIRNNASLGATALQSIPDEYITESELDTKGYLTEHQDISGKQDTLISGSNIKTINDESVLGEGNISLVKLETYNELVAQFDQLVISYNDLLLRHNKLEELVNRVFETLVDPWPLDPTPTPGEDDEVEQINVIEN